MDKELILNARKPKGELGSKMIDRMNKSHENLAQWGVSHLNIDVNDVILDIGCGGGVNVKRFSEIATGGKVYGMDYSSLSVEKSQDLNKIAIEEGSVEIIQGSVSDIPFEDETFDLITAFETVYFWPDFLNDLKEAYRVLKDNGTIFICNEAVGDKEVIEKMKEHIDLLDMKIYSEDELKSALLDAGFVDIKTFRKEGTNWMCVLATKD
ncbi:MAG: methyltransferase domain-containing protein [Methanobrevibacter sp.]|jgi:ubiquinone/menaquinone biosynthesis C-methylase UbiE|nr:methyltransferase domain-containing protein [Candidatus Methanoflexus mossambicus]